MKKILKSIAKNRWIIRAILPSIRFNFNHLPFSQAIKLPILIYKGNLGTNSGKFIINGPIKFGMIKLGVNYVSLYPNTGISLNNNGSLIFNGKALIGNASSISVNKTGTVEFGDNFSATASLKLACYHSISTENNVLIGWDTMMVDTDFHKLTNVNQIGGVKSPFGAIHIGHDVWIANGCKLYKNTSIPPFCVVGADTILHKNVEAKPYSLITNKIETRTVVTNMYLNRDDDKINYPHK